MDNKPPHPLKGKPSNNRLGKGGFQPGVSGNPGGRPKVSGYMSELARAESEACLRLLIEIRDNPEAKTVERMAAANALLDRGIGKPTQFQEVTHKRDGLDELLEQIDGSRILPFTTQ